MSTAAERLERLLGGPSLRSLRERLRRRYEAGRTNDVLTLGTVSAQERRALEGLLGVRSRDADSIQVSVTRLDDALARAGVASSLRDALEQLDGPIRDVAAERVDRGARWSAVFAACSTGPLSALVAQATGRGLVKRLALSDPDRGRWLLDAAAKAMLSLPAGGVPLSHVAANILGDAHALDEGRPIGTLVLAAMRNDVSERPRDIWARSGVLVGELNWPALVLNLPASAETPCGQLAQQARERGEPLHLSLRMLLRDPTQWKVNGQKIFVCENSAVIAMAADRLGPRCPPLACTDGMPSAAQRVLLVQLAAAGALLQYHGDFDWPGIAIGNFVIRTFNAQPWRFRSEDYMATTGRPLEGTPVAASWDEGLAPKMVRHACALDEEAVVDALLQDLT